MLKSCFISITTKYVGMNSWKILTGTSSTIPKGYFTDWSANQSDIFVGLRFPRFSVLQTQRGIKLTQAPKFHIDWSMTYFPIAQGKNSLILQFWWNSILYDNTTLFSECYLLFIIDLSFVCQDILQKLCIRRCLSYGLCKGDVDV